jgi:hypothetical protein
MANPTKSDLHVNRPLSNMSVAYMQDTADFIADKVFPNVPVEKSSDRYFVIAKDAWFRDDAQERGLSQESAGGGYEVDNTPTYLCRTYSYHKDIDDKIRPDADAAVVNQDKAATEFVTRKGLLKREKVFVSNFFTTGKWGLDRTGVNSGATGSQFNRWDQSGSTPIADVENERIRIAEQTGYRPNKLVIGPYVFKALKSHAEILDRIKYTQRGQVTKEILAALFEVDEILIPFATENTARQGQAASMSFAFGKHALLVYAAPAPALETPSGGYTISWNGLLGASALGGRIRKFRMENITSDRIEIDMSFDMKLVAADVGTFFNGAVV